MEADRRVAGLLRALGLLLLLLGAVARVAPLLDQDQRLLKQWPTEDGYLMLTIARNMALGHGMSTSDGTLPTNGTQPLATALWAVAFAAVDEDKRSGVLITLLLQFTFSVVAAALLYGLARTLFIRSGIASIWALFVTGIWYSSALVVPHSMNCLESGLYVMLVLAAGRLYLGLSSTGRDGEVRFPWVSIAIMAIMLSVCFYARNDAVFLIAAFCISCLLRLGDVPRIAFDNLGKVLVAGLATVLIALPWLVNNVVNFGHLMPISGVAQSEGAPAAVNAPLIPVKLFEYFSVVLPIPSAQEGSVAMILVCAALVIAMAAFCVMRVSRLPLEIRHFASFIAMYAVMLLAYYGILHGAPYFMARYLFPLSPFIAIVSVAVLASFVARLPVRAAATVACLVAGLSLVISGSLNLRLYRNGSTHMHEQVVDWVRAHVRDSDWIGAVQTGTLGFFHDRTVNLDGKVNPEALEAVLSRTVPVYVNKKQLVVLADWYGVSKWIDLPGITENFEVLVADKSRNLGVLGRRNWQPLPAGSEPSPFSAR